MPRKIVSFRNVGSIAIISRRRDYITRSLDYRFVLVPHYASDITRLIADRLRISAVQLFMTGIFIIRERKKFLPWERVSVHAHKNSPFLRLQRQVPRTLGNDSNDPPSLKQSSDNVSSGGFRTLLESKIRCTYFFIRNKIMTTKRH